jgi:SAM-dependent methyltransferase
MSMTSYPLLDRLWRRTSYRASRFHNEKGYFALATVEDIRDCAVSLATTFARVLFRYRPQVPWITMKAFRFLRQRLPAGARVFEWSSGTSTIWFEKHCAEVHSVEDNPEWFRFVSGRLQKARLTLKTGSEYVNAVAAFPDSYFDLISIDGTDRLPCFEIAHRYLKPGGILLIDNTDKNQQNHGVMWQLDVLLEQRTDYEIRRFPGWVHGTWSPIETTICLKREDCRNRL